MSGEFTVDWELEKEATCRRDDCHGDPEGFRDGYCSQICAQLARRGV